MKAGLAYTNLPRERTHSMRRSGRRHRVTPTHGIASTTIVFPTDTFVAGEFDERGSRWMLKMEKVPAGNVTWKSVGDFGNARPAGRHRLAALSVPRRFDETPSGAPRPKRSSVGQGQESGFTVLLTGRHRFASPSV